ncbi:ABC transporter substrate-binding protein [Anaerocolumna sp. AGMB13025]|uniref:ABC transporter substrate-binding protein n=1 Tax=Anaerocolumna sp. AGMB13025 TaxID=3039116 RepID=UPI00241F0927|nr:ABC transporter substrate-binding protein [Anaerocolumna sp. AGMB13025]WFR56539.1 ABC transporter substrate-binding protein [Anaerocolumna sp. AGMB13025]
MRRRITAVLILLVLVVTSFSGCSKEGEKEAGKLNNVKNNQTDNGKKEDKKGDKKEPTMGRYMEEKVKLPDLAGDETMIKVLENKDKQIEVFTANKGKYNCYRLKEDMTWESSTPEWLNNKLTQGANKVINDICMGEDGNYYLVVADYSNDTQKSAIIKSAEGKTAQKVNIPYLDKETTTSSNYKHYPGIVKIQVLENGSMVLSDMWESSSLLVFSPDGKKTDKVKIGQNQYGQDQNYITNGNDIITINEDGTSVMFYDTQQKQIKRSVDFNNKSNDICYAMKNDGTLLLGDSAGIHRLQKDGTLWETVVDGSLNSMSMPSFTFANLFVKEGEQEEYYGVYGNGDRGYVIMHYVFDKNVASVPSKEITVYSLKENSTVRQAIALFQSENTDIKVNYVVAMGEEAGKVTDYIRALNTELLAGNGADVLILDGLPVDSYIEKGVLADINNLISPLEESGELLKNITGGYQKDGKVYQVPLRFSIPIIQGKSDAIKASDSLSHIADYIKQNKDKTYSGTTTYKQLLENYLALYSSELIQNGQLSDENFTTFLKNIKAVSENIKATETNEENRDFDSVYAKMFGGERLFLENTFSILKGNETTMSQIRNVYDTILFFAIMKDKEISYQAINQMFIPNGLVGLNSKSKESEIAQRFISFLFKSDVQDSNVYDGFPVNSASLDKWFAKEDDGMSVASSDQDGNEVSGGYPVKAEREAIRNIALSLNKPIQTNYILNDLIVEEVLPYLKGEIDENQALAGVKAKVNTYLAE